MSQLLPGNDRAVPALQEYLDHSIPLLEHMQVKVERLDEAALEIRAPLFPNRNHIGTAFGGSLNSLAVLSGWGVIWLLLHHAGIDAAIVIHEGHMNFHKPAKEDFVARCLLPTDAQLRTFMDTLRKRGRSRISLDAEVVSDGVPVATFKGGFAAMIRKEEG